MRLRSILAAVLAALLFLAACGGDSGDPESLASEQQQDDGGSDSDSNGSGSDSDSDSGSDSDDDIDLPDGDDIPDVFGGDCVEFALAYSTVFLGGLAAAFGSEEDVQEMQSELEDLGGSVPSEIADEFQTLQEAYADYFDSIGDEGIFGAGDIETPEDDPDVVAAQETIDDWLAENCDDF